MTREEALADLKAAADQNGDIEAAHADADTILCQLLTTLGYADVVEAWEKVEKWYA